MREGNKEGGAVICPFYSQKKDRTILCERLWEGQTIGMNFRGNEMRDKYLLMYCEQDPERCKLHKMLWKSYEE